MTHLSPKARALVQAGRGAQRPSASDRDRVKNALQLRLGAAALSPDPAGASPDPAGASPDPAGASPPASIAAKSWWIGSGFIAGIGVVGAVLLLGRAPGPDASRQGLSVPVATTLVAARSTETLPDELVPPTSIAPPAVGSSSERPLTSTRPKQDRLAQEVALLSRATSSLHAGRAAEALKILDEHQRKFPGGLLTEERRAARAQALCSLGRVSEARADLARLPRSPAVARARQVCEARAAGKL